MFGVRSRGIRSLVLSFSTQKLTEKAIYKNILLVLLN